MTSKTTIGLAAIGLALMALAPVANASTANPDDTISRTFPYLSVTRGEIDPQGIGWYDTANPPNICIVTLLGVQVPVGSDLTYYDQLRIFFNFPGWREPVTVGTSLTIPVLCPPVINPLCNTISQCGIQIRPITIGPNVRGLAAQSGIPCDQASGFVECILTGSYWYVGLCPYADAHFFGRNQTAKDAGKGVLGGTGVNDVALSKDIGCDVTYQNTYDVSYLLGNPDLASSGFEAVTISLVVPYANGVDDTGFFVSCLGLTYTEVDTSTPIPTITSNVSDEGVDWFQVLDLDGLFLGTATTTWVEDLSDQFGTGDSGQLLAGLYDLGAKNDCDFTGLTPPQCHDGIDNEATPDGDIDEGDLQCYADDPNLNGLVKYYNPQDNDESM